MKRKLGFLFLLVTVSLAIAFTVAVKVYQNPLPGGRPGPAADALARTLQSFTAHDAWKKTGAVTWTMFGHDLLWDRARGFVRVRWRNNTALFRTSDQTGVALEDETVLKGDEASSLLSAAYAIWINDSYWLNPTASLFDARVRRTIATDGLRQPGLLVHYGAGGVTPGDTYLWLFDQEHQPIAFRMWVEVLPVQGLEISFEGWKTLSTGAKIATRHRIGPMQWSVEGLKAGRTLADLVRDDPFSALKRGPATQPVHLGVQGFGDAPPGGTRTSSRP